MDPSLRLRSGWCGSDIWVRAQGAAIAKAIWFQHYFDFDIEVSWSGGYCNAACQSEIGGLEGVLMFFFVILLLTSVAVPQNLL